MHLFFSLCVCLVFLGTFVRSFHFNLLSLAFFYGQIGTMLSRMDRSFNAGAEEIENLNQVEKKNGKHFVNK